MPPLQLYMFGSAAAGNRMIAIYSNTREWGGVDVLIARFAEYLRSQGIPFYIIEPRESRLRQELTWAAFVEDDEIFTAREVATHVLIPTVSKLRDERLPWQALGDAKVFTWVVHPNDVFRAFFPFSTLTMKVFGYRMVGILKSIFRAHSEVFDTFFCQLVESHALAAMDGATSRSLKYFVPSIPCSPPIIPIPSPLHDFAYERKVYEHDELSIGYLGRMDSMKWSAVKPFIKYVLAPMTERRQISLHVVTEGSHLAQLERTCRDSGIELHGYGYLSNKQAREAIISQTDFAVAMGTSALDLAGSGHPCLVLDPSLGMCANRQCRFRFVYETSDYTLGEYRDFPYYVPGTREFAEMVVEDELRIAAALGIKYVEQTHDPRKCFQSLLVAIQSSRVVASTLLPSIRALATSFANVKSQPVHAMVKSIALSLQRRRWGR